MFHRFPPHDQNSCRIVTKPRDDEESTSAQSAVQAKVPWRDDPTGRLTKSATAVRRGTEPKHWRAIGQSWPVGCIKDFTDHKTAWKFKELLMGKCETMLFFCQLYLMANLRYSLQILPLSPASWQTNLFLGQSPKVHGRSSTVGKPRVVYVQIWALSLCADFRAEVKTRKRSDGKETKIWKIRGCTTYKAENLAG